MNRTAYHNFTLISTHLEYTYNEFLLERALVQRLKEPPAELLNVSRSLLSTMLVLTGNRHRQGLHASDLPWVVSMFSSTKRNCSMRLMSA